MIVGRPRLGAREAIVLVVLGALAVAWGLAGPGLGITPYFIALAFLVVLITIGLMIRESV